MPAGLGGVDVADSRDHCLVEQHRLDGPTFAREAFAEMRRGECRVLGFGAESERWGRIRGMPGDGTERARIDEHGAPAIVEVKGDARMRRQQLIATIKHPVAIHAKVNQQRGTIGEMDELMLPSSLDLRHTLPLRPLDGARGEMAPLRWVMGAQLLNHPSAQDAAEALHRKLDFR